MHRTAAEATTTSPRANISKEAVRSIKAWLLDASVATALIAVIALATALTSH